MIRCEHFIYGMFNGVGYRLIKTSNIDQILSKKSLRHLKSLDGDSAVQTLLPEGYVAVTYLRHDKDEYGRKTVWNHTILLTVEDYFNLHSLSLFEPYFIKNMTKPPATLKPLTIKK